MRPDLSRMCAFLHSANRRSTVLLDHIVRSAWLKGPLAALKKGRTKNETREFSRNILRHILSENATVTNVRKVSD